MLRPGDDIDIWVIEAALGTGGMGSVYRCHNRSAKRILAAVKVLDAGVRTSSGAQERFVREAEILYQLDHPNIVKVRNVRIDSDPAYIEMEFVSGESLERRLRRGGLPFEQALGVMQELSDAVCYIHNRGVCHRDLKPANILIDKQGHTRIVDFGLALESDRSRLTQAGMTFGTVSYAPPEWITPEEMIPQNWDLYGLGVIFWEILTGRVAFAVSGQGSMRQQAMQVIMAKQDHPPLDPGSRYHPAVRRLIAGMTHSDVEERFATMEEVVEAVRALTPDMVQATNLTLTPAVQAREAGPQTWAGDSEPPRSLDGPETLVRPKRTAWVVLALAALVAAIVALGSGAFLALQLGGPEVPLTRDVSLSLTNSGDLPVRLLVGGQAVALEDGTATLANQDMGDLAVTWIAGEGCMSGACPGDACPSWCATGVEVASITPGEGMASITIEAPNVPLHPVTIALPERPDGLKARVLFDTVPVEPNADGEYETGGVVPGTHTAVVALGECPDDLSICPENCPTTCTVATQALVVSWDAEATTVSVDMPLPEIPVAEPVPQRPSGRFVTHAAFSRWLSSHPEFEREAALASGKGTAGYLTGWDGATPPPGLQGTAMVNVSWSAANAYCSGRGGLPEVGEEMPSQTGAPPMEYRVDGATPFVLEDGSRRIPVQRRSDSTPVTGFRCAR